MSAPTTDTRETRYLLNMAEDLIVVEHRLRAVRRNTNESATAHLDQALAHIAAALDCAHVEHQARVATTTGPTDRRTR